LDWLCEFRDRKVLMHQPGTSNERLPAKVREFYETQLNTPEKAVVGGLVRRPR